MHVVDRIANAIRDELVRLAPHSPKDEEMEKLEREACSAFGYKFVRRGLDIDGRPFVEVGEIPRDE